MREEKRKRICLPLGLALCIAAVAAQWGCAAGREEPVIAERTTRLGEDESGLSAASGAEAERGEQEEKRLAEQMEVPERYRADLDGEQMTLRADADIEVPDVNAAPVLRVERESAYTEEDFARFKEVVGKAEGIRWEENEYPPERDSDFNSCTSTDKAYYVSFNKGTGGETPLIWLNQRKLTHGSGDGFDSADLTGMELSAGEQKQLQETLCQKAETILSQLGLGDFELTDCRWRALSRSTDYRWVRDGRYGLRLRYCRTVNKITEPAGDGAVWGTASGPGQYVEFVYAQDGELVELKDIDRRTRVLEQEEEGFLLPFSAVAQIFEQYIKTYLDSGRPAGNTAVAGTGEKTKIKEPTEPVALTPWAFAEVTKVRLEYRLTYETEMGETGDRGRLEPVWNFYGSVVVMDRNWEEAMAGAVQRDFAAQERNLLASIRATDGQVMGN